MALSGLLKRFYGMSTVLLERVVLAVVFQAVFQGLFQLFDAAAFHEHVPVGTCGLFLFGVCGGVAVDEVCFLTGLCGPYRGDFCFCREGRRGRAIPSNVYKTSIISVIVSTRPTWWCLFGVIFGDSRLFMR